VKAASVPEKLGCEGWVTVWAAWLCVPEATVPVLEASDPVCELMLTMPERLVLVANEATPAEEAWVCVPDGTLKVWEACVPLAEGSEISACVNPPWT
jgi:hypothetical protein